MSHFIVAVIGGDYETQLEPFWENLEVEPYEDECWCVNSKAWNEAREKAQKELGYDLDHLRNSYHAMPEEDRPEWQDYIKEYSDLAEKYEKEHPFYKKPNPDCDDCEGKGVRESSYNPDSKWDWYAVGGRWSGYLKIKKEAVERGDYASERADQARLGDVDWIGMIQDIKNARRERWNKAQEHFKNGEKLPVEYTFSGLTKKTTYDEYVNKDLGIAPYSLLVEGEWIEKGQMGWFGMSDDKFTDEEWENQFMKKVTTLDPDMEITMVDCHI